MSLFDIFNNNAQTDAARAQIAGIQTGLQQALPNYQAGINALTSYGAGALAPSTQNWTGQVAGTNQLGNALGLGGASGNAQAIAAFMNNPGYQFQLQQGNNAILAQNAARGGTGSGNEALDLSKFNQNLANTSWNNYISNLQPYLSAANQSAGQIAGTNLAIGGGLNSAYGNIGNAIYGANTSIGNANANAALGNLTGSANLWGLGTNAAGLGAGLLGFLSDVKVKEDIAPVGKLADGQTVYRYRYAGDPRHQIGLIAQEVEGTAPEAVFDATPDLKGVDYRRATERAAKILEFTRERFEPTPTHRPFGSELMELAA